jgi:prepilin signal peptidase PulO-like enzyme (type II secretory pathway)
MLNILISTLIFLTGLIVGSFLNCVIYRTELQEDMPKGSPHRKAVSFLRGKSFCPKCKHILSWQDLIPVFSFIILKGECRYCKKPISWQYPLVELATGLLFLLIFNLSRIELVLVRGFQFSPQENLWFPTGQAIFNLIITCFLIIIFVYDLKHYIIPDKVIYPAIAIVFLYNIFYSLFIVHDSKFLIQSLFSALGAAVFFLLIVLISRGRWMGVGDIKLAFLMGLFLAFPKILVALFLAFFVGAIIGLGLIIAGKKKMKSEVPFGPFLVTGTFLAIFFGQKLISWYLNLFLI